MNRRVHTIWAILAFTTLAFMGCRPQQPFYLHEDGDLSHYVDVASDIEYPDVNATPLAEVTEAFEPLTLENLKFKSYWRLTLEEAIKTSLHNAKAMRSLGGRFVSSAFNNRAQTGDAPDALTTGPDVTRTVYDPAITETTPFSGVEAALSAFDARWSTNLFYQKNNHQQNVNTLQPVSPFFTPIFNQNTATFNTQLTKVTGQGGQFTIRNNIVYDLNNNPTRQQDPPVGVGGVPKDWNLNYEMSFNQPLLAGAGAEFNRIAGPVNPFTFIPGNNLLTPGFDGVLLARINVDVSLAEFEIGVRNLVNDTESAYWELAFAWRNLETSNTALNSAKQTWKKIHLLYVVGSKGGEAKEEAQAREQYFQFKSTTQTLLNELLRAEGRLRYVMGIATTDGRLIQPIDKPTVAKVNFDWREITEEALARSVDLRRQKWRIKQQELQVIAAKNLLQPRLDLNGTYRWLGLGDELVGTGRAYNANTQAPGNRFLLDTSAAHTLASGQFQEWALGAQMIMPLGFRQELAQVRFYQLSLARERAKLQDEELEVSHQLVDAVRQLNLNYQLTQTNFNRTLAADRQVEAVAAAFEAETVTLDQLLEAQRRRAEAQTSYFRTLLDYQRAIITVHLRKGSLLEYNGVYLAEGPWPAKAKFDAHRLARQRDASLYLNYGYTRPSVFSQGPINQNVNAQGGEGIPEGTPAEGVPHEAVFPADLPSPETELLPSPESAEPSPENSTDARRQSGLRTAAANKQGFDWGPLGLNANDIDSAADTSFAEGTSASSDVPREGRLSQRQRRTASAHENTKFTNPTGDRKPQTRDGSVRKVKHQDWNSALKHESVENQPSGPTVGPAASGQGS
ncbi:MAG: TolC family protein [Planctomycetia bacterium]|nr:TolC family protein [Planctomycetia bacterium]